MTATITNYVIAGYDNNDVFKGDMTAWEKRAREVGDVKILTPKQGESLQAMASQIKPPANIILAAHGGKNGSFEWNKGQGHYYSELFAALPRTGIQSITIGGCYGGSAQNMLTDVPSGTILQSSVGASVPGFVITTNQMAKEITARKTITPLGIMLEALDNHIPEHYEHYQNMRNNRARANPEEAKNEGIAIEHIDANEVLPHTIGIGGKPPIKLDLNIEMKKLAVSSKAGSLDVRAFESAIAAVKEHFDTDAGQITVSNLLGLNVLKEKTGIRLGPEADLDNAIDSVAKKLKDGVDPKTFTLKEKRIAYAITVADLHTSGTIVRLVEQGKKSDAQTIAPDTILAKPIPTPAPKPAPTPVPTPTTSSSPSAIQWSGQGSEITAKIQAIVEKVFHVATDRGGADDNKVDGLMGRKTIAFLKEKNFDVGLDNDNKKILDTLMCDPRVKAVFGTMGSASGEQIANVSLQKSNSAERPR